MSALFVIKTQSKNFLSVFDGCAGKNVCVVHNNNRTEGKQGDSDKAEMECGLLQFRAGGCTLRWPLPYHIIE